MVRATGSRREPPVRVRGLTGYRFVLAVVVLVALATVPMLLAVAAGRAALERPAAPAVEPFLSPGEAVSPADPGQSEELAEPEGRPGGGGGDTGWSPPRASRMLW